MMSLWRLAAVALISVPAANALPHTLDGIYGLADRLFPGSLGAFEFQLTVNYHNNDNWSRWNPPVNDNYTVKAGKNDTVLIEGTTLSALARGLRHYANEVLNVDDHFFTDKYKATPASFPPPPRELKGASVVPWRYNLNTVTFSYTFAWYEWEEWERFLDWAALRGVNLQLAWVGYEMIFLDVFREIGLHDKDILPFFSGPAFQAWNRFGNIRGSWGGKGDVSPFFIDQQFSLQKKIIRRMTKLGITPVLPAFPGFVPASIKKVRPDANLTESPNWFAPSPDSYTRDLFLSPLDSLYSELQYLFIQKQNRFFGNVTNIYTLDQFNELAPASGDTKYLSDISNYTYSSLTRANPAAIWLLQGWLFYSSRDFWTQPRIDAYLGGVTDNQSMLILDLYSEANPQWQRTNSYSGKPWIWCQLHNFGGNMALEGRVQTITSGPIDALSQSKSLVGFGLTPEGFEGNEIVYDILLDQAWNSTPLDTKQYFKDWTTRRYGLGTNLRNHLYEAWEILRSHVYSNTRTDIPQVPVATYQLRPALDGIVNRTGHFPHPTAVHYDPAVLQQAWGLMLQGALRQPVLLTVPAFQLDFIDVSRQVLSNEFDFKYIDLRRTFACSASGSNELRSAPSSLEVKVAGQKLLDLLSMLDYVLNTHPHFRLDKWVADARMWGVKSGNPDLFTFNARSQVTVWMVNAAHLNDYAAKAWSGLVGSYYKGRWSIFVDALVEASGNGNLDQEALVRALKKFEAEWQAREVKGDDRKTLSIELLAEELQKAWPDVFPQVS